MTMTAGGREHAERVYAWEREHVEPYDSRLLSRPEATAMVGRAAALGGIRVPSIRFAKAASMSCRAIPGQWSIVIADWGRTPVTLLHEVAHLAAWPAVLSGEDPHGPAFLRQAIAYYSGMLGMDRGRLEGSAAACGLRLRPAAGRRL